MVINIIFAFFTSRICLSINIPLKVTLFNCHLIIIIYNCHLNLYHDAT